MAEQSNTKPPLRRRPHFGNLGNDQPLNAAEWHAIGHAVSLVFGTRLDALQQSGFFDTDKFSAEDLLQLRAKIAANLGRAVLLRHNAENFMSREAVEKLVMASGPTSIFPESANQEDLPLSSTAEVLPNDNHPCTRFLVGKQFLIIGLQYWIQDKSHLLDGHIVILRHVFVGTAVGHGEVLANGKRVLVNLNTLREVKF